MTTIKAILAVALLGWVTGCGALAAGAGGFSAGLSSYRPEPVQSYQPVYMQQTTCRTTYAYGYAVTTCR